MKILAIDSSAKSASVAIVEDKKLLGEFFLNTGFTHSQTLMPMIENLLKSANVKINDLNAFAVNVGPGSFTGIRIGIATIKGLAFFNDIPCVPVSTLYSMSYNLLQLNKAIICAVMDARCQQVYNAIFSIENNVISRLTPDRAISIQDLHNNLLSFQKNEEKIILVGDGADLCYDKFKDNLKNVLIAPEAVKYQRASSVAFVACELLKQKKYVNCIDIRPEYLRLSQAERELKNK